MTMKYRQNTQEAIVDIYGINVSCANSNVHDKKKCSLVLMYFRPIGTFSNLIGKYLCNRNIEF